MAAGRAPKVRKGAAAAEAAEELASLVLERHSADNVTVIDLCGGKDGWQQHSSGKSGNGSKGGWTLFGS